MRGICCENHPSHAEARRTPLLQFIRADVGDAILARLGVAGEDLFILHRLSSDVLLAAQTRRVNVGHPVKAVVRNAGRHVQVGRVHDEVAVPVAVFLKVIIRLAWSAIGLHY